MPTPLSLKAANRRQRLNIVDTAASLMELIILERIRHTSLIHVVALVTASSGTVGSWDLTGRSISRRNITLSGPRESLFNGLGRLLGLPEFGVELGVVACEGL